MRKYELYSYFDEPVPYKSILIYPVRIRDWVKFSFCSDVLTLEKNDVPDMKIITMSYLNYIFYSANDDNNNVAKLHHLLLISLRKSLEIGKSIDYISKNDNWIIKIEDEEYNADDFENIREIIAEINVLELPDETIDKPIRDRIKDAKRIRASMSGKKSKPGTVEDLIVSVLLSTSLKLEEIYDLTIRKFLKILDRADLKLHYQIYLSASMSGMVEFKDKSFIKHWLSSTDNEKSELVEYGKVESKINGST